MKGGMFFKRSTFFNLKKHFIIVIFDISCSIFAVLFSVKKYRFLRLQITLKNFKTHDAKRKK